jgi:osmotically-inducible protein OsmY
MAHDVFISYSTKDKAVAEALCATLEAQGVQCWIAPRNITYGSDYGAAIVDGINESRVMVLVFSSNANSSPHIKREVDRAVSKGLTIIPIRIEDVAPSRALEYYISPVHWLDATTPPIESHLHALAGKIQVLLATSEPAAPTPAVAGASPPAHAAPRPVAAAVPVSRRFGLAAVIGGAVAGVVLGVVLWAQPWSSVKNPEPARLAQIEAQQRRDEAARQAKLDERRLEEAAKRAEETKRAEDATKRGEEARRADDARRAQALEEQKRAHVPVVAKPNQESAARPDPAGMKALVEQKLRARGLLKQSNADRWGVIVDITTGGVVTLTGVLRNNDERNETVRLAGEVPGVSEVKPRINVPQSWNPR